MVEDFFKKDAESEKNIFKMKNIDDLPEWIRGLTIASDPVTDFDDKAEYHKHLLEKYNG